MWSVPPNDRGCTCSTDKAPGRRQWQHTVPYVSSTRTRTWDTYRPAQHGRSGRCRF